MTANQKCDSTFNIKLGSVQKNKVLENLIITDISNAQELTESGEYISRIDLIIEETDTAKLVGLTKILPESIRIQKSNTRSETGKQMTESFRINLTAMSLLALIVGMFLIYNTMTFSVVQRQKLIGLLRSIGVTRGEIFRLIMLEALTIGQNWNFMGMPLESFWVTASSV